MRFIREKPLTNEERNRLQILYPPKFTIRGLFWGHLMKLGHFVGRHFTQRKRYRLLDNARLLPSEDAFDVDAFLQELREGNSGSSR